MDSSCSESVADGEVGVRTVLQVVEAFYAARQIGNREGMFANIHPNIVMTTNAQPHQIGQGETVIGIAAVKALLRRVGEHWIEDAFVPGRLRVVRNTVTCRVAIRLRHRRTNALLDGHKSQIWTVRDGVVTAMSEVFDAGLVNAIHRLDGAAETPTDSDPTFR